uniref:O-methyltransferase C-terminal domain-containing protein n=1 Tax=Oryza glumipatula TaxID=40148 RepID=A0A0D9ZH26_9ORYZ
MAAAVVRGGPSAFERAHGMPLFDYMGTNHRFNTLFNQAMSQQSMMVMNKLLDRFHGFDGIGILVDVGGGSVTLEMIISRYKHITGVNFDLPHVIAQAPSLPGTKSRNFLTSLIPIHFTTHAPQPPSPVPANME